MTAVVETKFSGTKMDAEGMRREVVGWELGLCDA